MSKIELPVSVHDRATSECLSRATLSSCAEDDFVDDDESLLAVDRALVELVQEVIHQQVKVTCNIRGSTQNIPASTQSFLMKHSEDN